MWTPITRRQHSRDGLRYETDLTDAEWALTEPLLPEPNERGFHGPAEPGKNAGVLVPAPGVTILRTISMTVALWRVGAA